MAKSNTDLAEATERNNALAYKQVLEAMERRCALVDQCRRGFRDEDGEWQGGLYAFVKYFWDVLEPEAELKVGWPLEAMCQHLEAVTFGDINRLLINVPFGFMKSMLTDVYWPAWEWGPMDMAHLRYVAFSYASTLTERDNERFGRLVNSEKYQVLYGDRVTLVALGKKRVSNTSMGWKFASSVGGVGTGERGDRIICFPADQMVQTEAGPKPIGDIVQRRLAVCVPSMDVATGKVSMRPIIGWHQNPGSAIVKITLNDGSTVRCTPAHRIWNGEDWVEASSLRSGATLPVAGLAQAFCDGAPSAAHSDVLNGASFYSVFFRKRGTGQGALDYLQNFFLRKDSPTPRRNERSMFDGVGHVLLSSPVFNVVQCAIKRLSVFVPNLLALWTRTYEGLGNKPMHKSEKRFSFLSKVNAWIAIERRALHDLAAVGHGVSALYVTSPIKIDSHSFTAPHGSWKTSHAAKGGDLIRPLKPNNMAPFLIVKTVEYDGHVDQTYCLTVERNHTFCLGIDQGLIASNCDDAHNVKESESDIIRKETVRWFRESMSSRHNDPKTGAIVVIMQRVHEEDVSGVILEEGLPYTHLCIKMEYERAYQYNDDGTLRTNDIGRIDPRHELDEPDGALAWPERFDAKTVAQLKFDLGPFAAAGQMQQAPSPRGGSIFERDWWQLWDSADGKFPVFEYIIASLDSAFTEKEENDPSGFTVWGIFIHPETAQRRVMLVTAWRRHLKFSGPRIEQGIRESSDAYRLRTMKTWGLVEHIKDSCRRFKVDKLLIEAKSSGISAAQELRNRFPDEDWAIQLCQVSGDKVARMLACQATFSKEMVYAPSRDWSEMVISEMAVAPKGRYMDLTDSSTQAISYLRAVGMLRSDEELAVEEREAVTHKPQQTAIYPV